MPITEIIKINNAAGLPHHWDQLAEAYFQKREFLVYCEKYNPCDQRYYLLSEGEQLVAGAVVYTLKIDLFTFSRIRSPVAMQVIGLPVSVSSPGLIGNREKVEQLARILLEQEKGLILGVNLDPDIRVDPGISMPILPNVTMDLPWKSWEAYTWDLRSAYRRRMQRIIHKFEDVSEEITSCRRFSSAHYRLYRAVMKRTPNKLEIIPEGFFVHLPEAFQLVTYSRPANIQPGKPEIHSSGAAESVMLCWHITCREDHRHYFFFGGMNYTLLEAHHSYFNNLFGILKRSLDLNCTYLDLGQTAEIPKMRLGGELVPKQMFLYHRNRLIYRILKKLKRFIGYHKQFSEANVFKRAL